MDDDKKRRLRGVLISVAMLVIGVLLGRGSSAANPTCGYVANPAPAPAADGTGSGGVDGSGSGG